MACKRYRVEDIIHKLREADVLISQGKTVAEVCRALTDSDLTYDRWRKEYDGLQIDQARRLRNWNRRTPDYAKPCRI